MASSVLNNLISFQNAVLMFIFTFSDIVMDEWTSFLEHPLDKDLYKPRKRPQKKNPPLRILITDAGTKIAYNILYNISSGNVFGPDQEIIFHLINSRGSVNHKSVVLELLECGFPCFKDCVVSSNAAIAFKKVDVVIAISTYEEMPGRVVTGALIYQMVKARQIIRNVQDYASKNCKIIFTGPSTKAITVLLGAFARFGMKIPPENISAVTHLDTVISKAMLAAKLRTTTDKIKNVVIWSMTYPDVRHATVRMYPPDDRSAWEMNDVSITEAVQDDAWLYGPFAMGIYRRSMSPDLLKFGKAIAMSTIHHLKVLMNGSDDLDEIQSMAVITPSSQPYGITEGFGFSFPVRTEKGSWKILQDVSVAVPTHLNMMRAMHNITRGSVQNSTTKIVSLMLHYEATQKQSPQYCPKYMDEVIETRPWTTRYFVTPNPAEGIDKIRTDTSRSSRKSILWNDQISKMRTEFMRSTIRFGSEAGRDSKKTSFFSYGTEEILSIFNEKSSSGNVGKQNDLYH